MAFANARWADRRQDNRIAENADQTELSALTYGRASLDAGTFDDRIAEALDDYRTSDPLTVEEWASLDFALDNAVSDLGIEITRRKVTLGKFYPFDVDDGQLIYRSTTSLAYEFCLAISQATSLNTGEFAQLPVAFEQLMTILFRYFLGHGSQSMRTGWPPLGEQPKRFKQVITLLNQKTNEWNWSPDYGLEDDPDPAQVKDEGLDFVAWKEVLDNRAGRLFVLGQCACGDNFEAKLHDLDAGLQKLAKWIKPVCYAQPLRAFCTPRHIPNDLHFAQVNRQAGLVFDRTRITLVAEAHANDVSRELPLEQFVKIVVPQFEVVNSK